MHTLRLLPAAVKVEYDFTREVLYRLGFGFRREENHLVVYPKPEQGRCPFVNKTTEQKVISSLYVDEGIFEGVWKRDSTIGEDDHFFFDFNDRWSELIDMDALLGCIVRKFCFDENVENSPYIGQKISARYYKAQYVEILDKYLADNNGVITWVDNSWPDHPEEVKVGVELLRLKEFT